MERPLAGSLDRLTVRSQLLAGNPLGDPPDRALYVYRPPVSAGAGEPLPSVYMLQGFGGRLEEWLVPSSSGTTTIEQRDAMFSAEESPPALIVFVDASTSWGGAQFLNSSSTGRYLDYLCDEVVPFIDARYPTLSGREHRGVSGKSSGGYGAMALSMLRPELFGALASHAGDALFECCYQPVFPVAARLLRTQFCGSWEAFEARAQEADFDWKQSAALFAAYGTACAYTPDPNRPGKALIPFDDVGRPIEEVWARWLALDPVRMAANHADALGSMRKIYLDAGLQDELFWISARRPCRANSLALGSRTHLSCSRATTTASMNACPLRSPNWCSPSNNPAPYLSPIPQINAETGFTDAGHCRNDRRGAALESLSRASTTRLRLKSGATGRSSGSRARACTTARTPPSDHIAARAGNLRRGRRGPHQPLLAGSSQGRRSRHALCESRTTKGSVLRTRRSRSSAACR